MQFKHQGPVWKKGRKRFLPLYEAKMVQMYDHRAASVLVDRANWMRQAQPQTTTLAQHQNPDFVAQPRWWVLAAEVSRVMAGNTNVTYLAYKDTTSATNQRTMIAAFVPHAAFTHPLPIVHVDRKYSMRYKCCLLANLNSLCYDFVARQKVGGVHLSFYLVEQIPTLPPDHYAKRCPWDKRQTLEKWISDRVLKLTCTADDMRPLAEAAGFAEGVHPWNEEERLELMAELDAAYFLLYGIERADAEYILSTFPYTQKSQSLLGPPVSIAEAVLTCYDRFRGA